MKKLNEAVKNNLCRELDQLIGRFLEDNEVEGQVPNEVLRACFEVSAETLGVTSRLLQNNGFSNEELASTASQLRFDSYDNTGHLLRFAEAAIGK